MSGKVQNMVVAMPLIKPALHSHASLVNMRYPSAEMRPNKKVTRKNTALTIAAQSLLCLLKGFAISSGDEVGQREVRGQTCVIWLAVRSVIEGCSIEQPSLAHRTTGCQSRAP